MDFLSFTSRYPFLSITRVTASELTLTLHWALTPLDAVAVMIALPPDSMVTLPLPSTDATEGLDDVQTMVLFCAELGVSLAVKLTLFPSSNVTLDLLIAMPLTPLPCLTTVTVHS